MSLIKKIEKTVVGDIWTSNEAFQNLTILCDNFGSRFAGTEGERLAVDFMVSKLKEYGLENVVADEFTYTGWKRGEARLKMLQPVERRLDTISLALCPPTPPEGIEGEIIYLGPGYPDLFLEKMDEIQGKIVMCSSQPRHSGESVHRRTKYGYSVKFGAIGFIFMNHNSGQLMPTGSLRPAYRMAGEIPGVGVSKETGSFIIRQIKKAPVKIRITTTDKVDNNAKSWNVVGEIPGKELRERLIVVGAHFDGHDIAQGALDDGSGAVTIMETARALAKYKGSMKRTIRFICFAAEELGVTGSTCYVDKHKDELDKIDLMINCDGAGRGLKHEFRVYNPQELVGYMKKLANKIIFEYEMMVARALETISYALASDHMPFFLQGIPSVQFITLRDPSVRARLGRGWGHTTGDTLDKVDPRNLKEGAIILAQFLIHLANEASTIAKRTSLEEIVSYLDETGVSETLRIQRKWHPDSIR